MTNNAKLYKIMTMATYITAQKAAEEAGVSTQTIRNWLSWKLLKGIMVTKNPSSERGRIYVDKDSLQELIESGKI